MTAHHGAERGGAGGRREGAGDTQGQQDAVGRPVGLQLVGRRRADWPLLRVAHAFEAATGYSQVIPPVLR